jgi:uncharacterized protein (DUF433 family)
VESGPRGGIHWGGTQRTESPENPGRFSGRTGAGGGASTAPVASGAVAQADGRWPGAALGNGFLVPRGDPHIFRFVSQFGRITVDPAVCHGKPVIRGLRYPVESMLEYLAAGDSIDDLLVEFPDLQREDLLACLEFAAVAIKLKTLHVPTAA